MGTVNSGLTCNPSYQEVKKTVEISCPSAETNTRTGGYSRSFNSNEYDYIETVYNEVSSVALTNGTLREKWDNSNDPRFQQYDINTGQPIFENYCRLDKGTDEGYFYNLWQYPLTHQSEKEVLVKYTPIYQTSSGQPTTDITLASTASVTAAEGACVRRIKITNNFTLGKVDINVTGLPESTEDSFIYWTATHKASLVFTYTTDTRTVIQVGDVLNGHTVTKVANFIDTKAERRQVHRVIGDSILKVNNIKDINVGDNITGFGNTKIPEGTTVKSIDTTNRTIKLNFPAGIRGLDTTNRKFIKNIIISDAEVNQVPDTNYCYAEFSSSVTSSKNLAFKVEGPGMHFNEFRTTTTDSGAWTNTKIDDEGGNQVFKNEDIQTINVNFPGGSLVMKAQGVDDSGEFDSKWWIESFTGTLPATGTSFQKTFDGGRGKVKIYFKVTENVGPVIVSGGDFAKNANYTGSISGANITAVAGYGIIDRAAMVGIIVSRHKDIAYEPIFNKYTEILPDVVNEVRSSFPGITDLRDLQDYQFESQLVADECDKFLKPQIEVPENIGDAPNGTKFTSSESEAALSTVENRLDQLVSEGKSVSDISNTIEKETTVITTQTSSQIEASNEIAINKLNKNSKKTGSNNEINPELRADTASTQLITNILNKFSEIPENLDSVLPELPETVTSIDGVAVISTLDGENESSTLLIKNAYRDLPVPQDNISFIADDISLDDDQSYQDYGKSSLRETINVEVTPRWLYGTPVVESENAGETEIRILGTALGGATPANDLYVLVKDVENNSGAVESNGFEIFNGSTPKMEYSSTGTLTTTQTRPTFNITGGGSGGSYTVAVANSGAGGFVVGQDFTFLGSTLGGVDGTNDLIVNVTAVDGSGNITGTNVFGTSANSTTYSAQTPLNTAATFKVNIEWSDTETTVDDVYVVSIADESGAGLGYQLGDVITVQGSNLGGTNTTHDLTITVTEIDPAGGLSDFDISGSPETLYTGVSGTNIDNAVGSGATFDVLKGETSTGSPTYIVSLNSGGSLYNTSVVPSSGVTVDVVDRRRGEFRVNGADLSSYGSYFQVSFGTTAPAPLSTGTTYTAYKTGSDRFYLFNMPATSYTYSTTGRGRFLPFYYTIRLNESLTGITGVTFGSNSVSQSPVYYTDPQTGVQYIEEINLTSLGEVYPTKSWKGANYEYQTSFVKEYEFDLVTTSENIAKSSFSKGNPVQLAPITAKMTQDLNPTSDTIFVDDTSKFLSSGYLKLPKWIRKNEIYLQLGKSGDANELKNTRNHYYYDGEEIIYYSGKTATSFTGIKRSQFDTSYIFETSLEPFKNNGGVVNSYQKGYSVQQYWAYSTDPSGEASQSGSSSSNINYGGGS